MIGGIIMDVQLKKHGPFQIHTAMGRSDDWKQLGLTDDQVQTINNIGYGTNKSYSGFAEYLNAIHPNRRYTVTKTKFDMGDFTEAYEVTFVEVGLEAYYKRRAALEEELNLLNMLIASEERKQSKTEHAEALVKEISVKVYNFFGFYPAIVHDEENEQLIVSISAGKGRKIMQSIIDYIEAKFTDLQWTSLKVDEKLVATFTLGDTDNAGKV
jgi:hypothetical protein